MHNSDHGKNSGSGFVRAVFRSSSVYKKSSHKGNPFHGDNISEITSHQPDTWTRSPPNTILPNLHIHSNAKQERRSPEPHSPTNSSASSNYIENTIRRNRNRSIPPRFEHRLNPVLDKPVQPTDQNWRPTPERSRSNSIDTNHHHHHHHHHKKRPLQVEYQGLRTAELSSRLRYAKREHLTSKHSSDRGLHSYPRRPPGGRGSVKDRLYLPSQPERLVKIEEITPTCSESDVSEFHIRSNTQNDPRIRNSQGNTPPGDHMESILSKSDNFFKLPSSPPIKSHKESADLFFDEVTVIKEVNTMDTQVNFDVPLPPTTSTPKQQEVQIIEKAGDDHADNVQSFWDEPDELILNASKGSEHENSEIIFSPVRLVGRVDNPRLSAKHNVGNFFDDDIPANQPSTSKSSQIHRPSSHHSKQPREHRRNEKRDHDKMKKYKRKGSPTPVKSHHSKKFPKKATSHSHPHPPTKHKERGSKHTPANLVSHSNAPILKFNTKSHTHIRLKKTVNLADNESEHSSTDDCTEVIEPRKLVIPLPNSPLQPLEVVTQEQVATPVPIHTDKITQIDAAVPNAKDTSQPIEIQDSTCSIINFASDQSVSQSVHSLEEFLNFRHQSLSEASDIGLHIEFVGANTPNSKQSTAQTGVNVEPSTPSNKAMSLLNIDSYKPISPKSELATPDSVFTPGFDPSQGRFSLDRRSPQYSATTQSSTCNDTFQSEEPPDSKYVSKHRSVKSMRRKSVKKSSKGKKTNSDNRTDCESSITNKEVSIPLTRLDVTQFGAKVKATSHIPDNISAREKQVIKVFSQWKCMFCHRGANEKNLGYLYGPYFKTGENLKMTPQPLSARKRASRDHDEKELWVHAPCALWSPGVFLVSFHLSGLVEAFESSQSMPCAECGQNGATLRCEKAGCASVYHYTCAETINCRFNHDCFKLQCPSHDSNLTNTDLQDL